MDFNNIKELIDQYGTLHRENHDKLHEEERLLVQIQERVNEIYNDHEVKIFDGNIEIYGWHMVTREDLTPIISSGLNFWVDSDIDIKTSIFKPATFIPTLKIVIEVDNYLEQVEETV